MRALFVAVLCVFVVKSSFVDSAPADHSRGRQSTTGNEDPDEVQQLEDLKNFGNAVSIVKSHSSSYKNVNGQKESHSETREQVNENGKVVASVDRKVDSSQDADSATPATRVETEVDVPSRGIHKTVVSGSDQDDVTSNGERRSAGSNQVMNPFSGLQYTPLDMAEYVFWTGDEKGVTLAIEEFLQEGLMTREEAISFLQEIKYNLDQLQLHYAEQGFQQKEPLSTEHKQSQERAQLIQKALRLNKAASADSPDDVHPEAKAPSAPSKKRMSLNEDKEEKIHVPSSLNREKEDNEASPVLPDEDYEEMLERLRIADYLYTQYSLEEVIYQLAKVMFSQSLSKGSADAQDALQKFTTFLEGEASQGHMSRNLEKKVLDVLIASLMDTLNEHPELSTASPSSDFLQQLINPKTRVKGTKAEAQQSTLPKGEKAEFSKALKKSA